MGKKKGTSSLGKGIIKDRSKSSKSSKVHDTWLHTSELNDGYDWNRINLKSVTEQSNLEDFLETAELAGTEFTAERLNVKVIDPGQHTGLPSATESIEITKAQRENIAFLQIPRRPKWDSTTSAERLNQMEKEAFLDWRRQLSILQEKDHIVLTPFERNLDFWRQLWRVIERSDVIVQIVDARNPLLFRCLDLEKYVKEVSSDKENIVLISKADLLTQAQREKWAEYFSQQGIRVAFWSAVRETERLEEKEAKEDDAAMEDDDAMEDDEDYSEEEDDDDGDDDIEDEDDEASRRFAPDDHLPSSMEGMVVSSENAEELPNTQVDESSDLGSNEAALSGVLPDTMSNSPRNNVTEGTNPRKEDNSECNQEHGVSSSMDMAEASAMDAASSKGIHDDHMDDEDVDELHTNHLSRTANAVLSGGGDGLDVEASCASSPVEGTVHNASHLLTGEELLGFFREVHGGRSKVNEKMLTVGMVGYPNVGKSSTINALLREKKVPVSATPGRTKHFQTLFVEPTLCLCDCPGLVMPSFVSTKADMYLNGILPIDQMRDFTPPVSLMCQRVPREVLELTYGMNLIKPREGEDPDRPPTALEFLNAHAYVRGFMTQKGVPDSFRSARIVLKDYVSGKVLYRIPPPGVTPEEFDSIHYPTSEVGEVKAGSRPLKSANKPMITEGGQTVKKSAAKKVDESFFAKPSVAHTKALPPRIGVVGGQAGPMDGVGFMGKPWKKQKRGKKEKLRKVYGHLDEK